MRIGYGRTSTAEQRAGLAAQERDLVAAGCQKIWVEQLSARAKERPQLDAALDFARDGDEFVVAKPDRLARSLEDLLAIERQLRDKGVVLTILSINLNTSDPTGRLVLQVMGAIAEFERALMLERQREGIADARAKGRYKGRKPTARAKAADVHALAAQDVPKTKISEQLGISRASVHRILGPKKAA